MGKSILILLILIITLVAAPFFGSFGEALDKPVVSAASTLSEYLFNQLSNSQDHLNQSLTVPERTAMYYECLWFTYESEVEFSVEFIPPEPIPGTSVEKEPGVWDDFRQSSKTIFIGGLFLWARARGSSFGLYRAA